MYTYGGDKSVIFPSDKAYPLGGADFYVKYYVLMTHLRNPSGITNENLKVNSGFRLFTTQTYRPIEFGILTVSESNKKYFCFTFISPFYLNQAQVDDDYLGFLAPNLLQNIRMTNLVRSSFMSKMGVINIFATHSRTFLNG